jgi:hypothetical protein
LQAWLTLPSWLGQIQQSDPRSDDLLFLGRVVISVPPQGGARSQPRPAPRLASDTNNDCQVSSSYNTTTLQIVLLKREHYAELDPTRFIILLRE